MKNRAALPRTAGLRTLSELASEMTKAGLDPSRIQERAEILAKVAGAKRKRLREDDDAEMDVDEPEDKEIGAGDDDPASDGEDSVNADGSRSNKKKKSQRFYCTDYPPCNLSFTRSEHLARHIR